MHDLDYATHYCSRAQADADLAHRIRDQGARRGHPVLAALFALIYWIAVRALGWLFWAL